MENRPLLVLCDEPRCRDFGGTHRCNGLDEAPAHIHTVAESARWRVSAVRIDDDREGWTIVPTISESDVFSAADADALASALLDAADFCRAAAGDAGGGSGSGSGSGPGTAT
ncbi:hypothetical protein FJ656_26135 [Schumannella luteola]|uniref:Uncharacterized protein n=1 Tax=Schumannella luteola TaxID=472059 RepID=A0A852YGJ9_9MICO|nr:hypothetical protein [Schumannella luteola]NYG98148.1 hypothetical protein [Schumannella luteola]TPX01865.1 hypothetical protein FJ656_26135 [Schumannella luteola]